ncbi:MAG TPA: type IV secretory system conjugative DNA transfer family protein [Steroidobacteraceae bacterium]|jgi:type IV secretion system protein VirD4|nr:type IV secretory system conjugative DNA transfer family protein [Steroidobacteraceae bacterium]
MSPSGAGAVWPKPGRAPSRGVLKALLLSSAALLLASELAGALFLWSMHGDPRRATPLTLGQYGYYYGDRAEVRGRLLGASGLALLLLTASLAAALLPRRRALHGEARFASGAEIKAAGLLGHEGVILGRRGRRCLMLAGQQGVALAAPPRAGKGTGVVVPNALNWPGSLVCVDIKRENWTITAGYRKACGQACFLFDPFAEDGRTARWNPFSYVSPDPVRRLNDLQRIAEMLYPDPPNVDPFWTASARSLFLGIALYLFETPSLPATIGEVLRQGMASDDEGFGQHWKRLIEGRRSGERPLSSQCVRSLYDVIDLAPVTASSIRKTFTSRLDLWLNPILDRATSASDFDLRDLRKKAISIYVGVNPDDLHRLRPVLNLFFQQAIGLQTRELPERNPLLRYQVMMLLDEFTALGRIPIIAEAISYLPGYNVRVVLVIQTPAQLREVYGIHNAETMMKSLAARIVFAPKDFADAREISDELGFQTVEAKTVSRPLGASLARRGARSRSETVSEQRRALLLPQEVKELGAEEAIVFYEGLRPIRCRKIRYFTDARFRKRLLPAPEVPLPALTTSGPATPRAQSAPVEGAASPETASAAPRETKEDVVIRDGTVEDIGRWESLTLEDFAVDFSKVEFPQHEGKMSDAEAKTAVASFLHSIDRG